MKVLLMIRRRPLALLTAVMRPTLFSTFITVLALALAAPAGAVDTGPVAEADDAVVIAVVDSGFSPYHQDFDATLMPQHRDGDLSNDLPLDTAPHEWLPGFPDPDTFATYDEISLTLDPDASTEQMFKADGQEWGAFRRTRSDGDDVHYRWLSGSKVIGAVDFSGNWLGTNNAHGAGVSSVSVGNRFGTCPECLVVLVTYDASSTYAYERASDWAMRQPWIDVVTNSYGYSTLSTLLGDKIYTGASVDVSRAAVERGQQVFYSAGNGYYIAPAATYYSSQKATDWVTTVGAVHPNGQAVREAGKGVDIASVGSSYPSMGGDGYAGQRTFGGTSNATPVSAGIYGRALWDARHALAGPSRVQQDGIVATGTTIDCGPAAPDCELGDGALTRAELQHRLYAATTRTDAGWAISQFPNPVQGVTTDEMELWSTGHGVFFGRLPNPITDEAFGAEHERVVAPMLGTMAAPPITQDTIDFLTVDSFCKQRAWGGWDRGYYTGTLPGPDAAWPVRTTLEQGCPALEIIFGDGSEPMTHPSPIGWHDED